MSVIKKFKRAVRGEISPTTATLEILRRTRQSLNSRKELSLLKNKARQRARFLPAFARMSPDELLAHFKQRKSPSFFVGFVTQPASSDLVEQARRITDTHRWALLGFGEKDFGEKIDWCLDPLSGLQWPLDYHRNINLLRGDGSDARVVWEVNRLGHLLTLSRAYAATKDEQFVLEFSQQLRDWTRQNPPGFGVNWTCAMEVALRLMNLAGAFQLFRSSSHLDQDSLKSFLDLIYQHGIHINRNLEFSYLSTSNHYLSDVVGLLWLGLLFPEFDEAEKWRDFGLREMLKEVDKQILPDGADFEASTGYHRFILELLLYSFILCKRNNVEIEARYWNKIKGMLDYVLGYLRPDGYAPLLGDTDSGQVFPLRRRRADDHAYLLAIGAVVFDEQRYKINNEEVPEELTWLLGQEGVQSYRSLAQTDEEVSSRGFADAGTYIMRDGDLYLCLNASGAGLNGRGSHGHNDKLAIEVSAFGRSFIVDPGTYVYGADLERRHEFRSTAFHSTVQIDGEEQNTTDENVPFVIGNEAQPRVLHWETSAVSDRIVAEHSGYRRLKHPVVHRRTIVFKKTEREWLIDDEFLGNDEHEFVSRFHFAPGLNVTANGLEVTARDEALRCALKISALNGEGKFELEEQSTSHDYGQRSESITACLRVKGEPVKLSWKVTPIKL